MTISSIDGSLYTSALQPAGGAAAAGSSTQSDGGPTAATVRHHYHNGGGGQEFQQALQQTLAQYGLNPVGNSASGESGASDYSTGNPMIDQDLHTLVRDLYSSISLQSPNRSSVDTTASSLNGGYSNFSTGLQNLIQEMSSGASASSNNSNLSSLQASFQKLMTDVQQSSDASANQSSTLAPSLQEFLRSLYRRLEDPSSNTGIGNVISTTS
ncbi:hypothetical protein [Paludibacterium yongneupense]|uniref:hypothetical protein n=1 Tax=Paludibacterium yongneupense TaxID=400061 RepID=UPI0003FCFA1E|nr:hypothetical protein [Paludibacterium yongneupense]